MIARDKTCYRMLTLRKRGAVQVNEIERLYGYGMGSLQTEKSVLTVKEVMADLGMSRNAIYEAIAAKQIPSIRIGRKILIPRVAYERFLRGEVAA